MASPSETLVFVDGAPLPVPIESVTYDVNVETESMTSLNGPIHRPISENIELHIEMCGYLPFLEFDEVHVIGQDGTMWEFTGAAIEYGEGQQIGDGYKTVWDITALSVEVKS